MYSTEMYDKDRKVSYIGYQWGSIFVCLLLYH